LALNWLCFLAAQNRQKSQKLRKPLLSPTLLHITHINIGFVFSTSTMQYASRNTQYEQIGFVFSTSTTQYASRNTQYEQIGFVFSNLAQIFVVFPLLITDERRNCLIYYHFLSFYFFIFQINHEFIL